MVVELLSQLCCQFRLWLLCVSPIEKNLHLYQDLSSFICGLRRVWLCVGVYIMLSQGETQYVDSVYMYVMWAYVILYQHIDEYKSTYACMYSA